MPDNNLSLSARNLGTVSSSLRRVSYFAQDEKYKKREELIGRFLADCAPIVDSLSPKQLPPYQEIIRQHRRAFHQLRDGFPATLISPRRRLVWAEEAMTLSLRLFHLSQALRKA